jgi:hypothetical protein
MKTYPAIGVQIPQILLPMPGIDLHKWAVIACDQFTSQPDYWKQVSELVGDAPSTYNLILPEVCLGTPEEAERVQHSQQKMREYLDQNLLVAQDGIVLVERSVDGKTRHGLMLALDLERYDYNKGSQTLIRATEGTIIERLPPRIKIRQGALLELPHILVLIDDPNQTVIEPVVAKRSSLKRLYDFELMMDSGHLRGYLVENPALEGQIIHALEALASPESYSARYGVGKDQSVLLFAMGDGNHSLATAKAIWEKIKPIVGMDHPARFAMVEIENVHDKGLDFEPIHRVLFGVKSSYKKALQDYFGESFEYTPCKNEQEMVDAVTRQAGKKQVIGVVDSSGFGTLSFSEPAFNLPVGTLQAFLDQWIKEGGAEKIDYVHGHEVVTRLASQTGNLGFYLPAMPKSDLFKTVILDGVLPRKTFSMGEAREKRFYMECRRIA